MGRAASDIDPEDRLNTAAETDTPPRFVTAASLFGQVQGITLLASLKTVSLRLWDEPTRKLVGFGHLKTLAADPER